VPYGRWFRTVWFRTGTNNKILSRLVLVWSCSAPRNRQGSMPGLIHQVWFFVRFTGHIYPGRDRTAASRWQPQRRGRSCHPAPCDLLQSGAVPVLSQDRCPAASSQKQELKMSPSVMVAQPAQLRVKRCHHRWQSGLTSAGRLYCLRVIEHLVQDSVEVVGRGWVTGMTGDRQLTSARARRIQIGQGHSPCGKVTAAR